MREPRILVESAARGETNLGVLMKKLSSKEAKQAQPARDAGSGASVAIASLSVTSGAPIVGDTLTVDAIDLHLRDLSRDRACSLALSARLWGGKSSRLQLEGKAGPFAPESIRLEDKL